MGVQILSCTSYNLANPVSNEKIFPKKRSAFYYGDGVLILSYLIPKSPNSKDLGCSQL